MPGHPSGIRRERVKEPNVTATICTERSTSNFREMGCSAVIPFSAKAFVIWRNWAAASHASMSSRGSQAQSVCYSWNHAYPLQAMLFSLVAGLPTILGPYKAGACQTFTRCKFFFQHDMFEQPRDVSSLSKKKWHKWTKTKFFPRRSPRSWWLKRLLMLTRSFVHQSSFQEHEYPGALEVLLTPLTVASKYDLPRAPLAQMTV